MNTTMRRQPLDTVAEISDLFGQGMKLSLDLLESLSASSISRMSQMMSPSTLVGLKPRLTTIMAPVAGSNCRIPPPCWAPQPIGEVTCHVCPGGTATVRLRITNCGPTRRDIRVESAGKTRGARIEQPDLALGPMERDFATASVPVPTDATSGQEGEVETSGKTRGVTIEPPNLALGPMERDFVTASVPVPTDAISGQEGEVLLWVHGCQNHYLRWTVKVASRGASCCHEVGVEDCPDLVHHWYDHFYCERPCLD